MRLCRVAAKVKVNITQVKVNIHFEDGSTETDVCDIHPYSTNVVAGEEHGIDGQPLQQSEDIPAAVGETILMADNSGNENRADGNNMSAYYKKIEKKQTAWENMRDEVMQMAFKTSGLLQVLNCTLCNEAGVCICKDCGPLVAYCQICAKKVHKNANILHKVEIMKVIN